ncbi:hypothetical protein SAMN05421749_10423 [Acinetobacter marinus]|uniref:Uncharacterized protein n=1 Tax=Acinetobacter marinus TaxID=281375 RepID=A0A1G6KDG8_9GAMM|nr:hypothetical protein [Acinetobacter marinus]SDC29132.1 hypothetical protein SAMN05421749_10423 [Acinetobacter marinus]
MFKTKPSILKSATSKSIPSKQNRQGIQFPQSPEQSKPSTSALAKQILHRALQALSAPESIDVMVERKWRKHYPRYFHAMVRHSIQSAQGAVDAAEQALAFAEQEFVVCRDQQTHSLAEEMQSNQALIFDKYIIKGQDNPQLAPWGIPYHGELLTGQALLDQIWTWETQGIIDVTHANALREAAQHPEWFDLSDRTVVLFGAASEAGPLTWLSKWKANIVAIDLPNEKIWQKIQSIIEAGNATLIAPMQPDAKGEKVLGADLLTQNAEIANWLNSFKAKLDLAGIAYLDGEKHVRVSMAMISIMKKVSQIKADSSIMFMLTPTDIYAIPKRVVEVIRTRKQARKAFNKTVSGLSYRLSQRHFFEPNDETVYQADTGAEYAIADCMVIEQGPNYALAKRLQQWYALSARAQGKHVSINIAPSTTTQSVVKNPLLKAAFEGAGLFDVEAFAPETTNAIMAALWIYDLNAPQSPSNPENQLAHPLQLLMENANHGGLWNVPYLARTALPFAAVYGFGKGLRSKYVKK